MQLTINSDYSEAIMEYLYRHHDVKGNEPELEDALLIDFIGQAEIWAIESALEEIYEVPITLSKDIKLIRK